MTFPEWITYLFDHPVTDPVWHWELDSDEYWEGPHEIVIDYITRTFQESGTLLKSFSDAQVNQGLMFLISGSCSNYMCAFQCEEVPLQTRLICIDSMATLFKDCFAIRCTPQLFSLSESGASPLNMVCSMWWMVLPIHGIGSRDPDRADYVAMDQRILSVIEQGLYLNSDSCIEGSLYGIAEWSLYYPKLLERMVNNFLVSTPGLRPELKRYALTAPYGGFPDLINSPAPAPTTPPSPHSPA